MKEVESGELRMESVLCALACICIFLFSSCERRELSYFMESEVSITVDWSKANLDYESTYGATAVFYPKDGSEPKVVLMGDRTKATARLREGHYSVIVFNRTFDDFKGIAFRGTNGYKTLEAYTVEVETRINTRTGETTRVIVNSPEKLAVATLEDFEVTEDMLGNYSPEPATRTPRSCTQEECSLHFVPKELTRTVQVEVNVKGLHNVKSANCALSGVPVSVFLADGRITENTATQEFPLASPVFKPGSGTEGTLGSTLNVFGFNKDLPHDLSLTANLVDGKTKVEQNLADISISEKEGISGIITLYIEANVSETIPDVKPEGGSDSGFDAEVGDWGEEENSNIII